MEDIVIIVLCSLLILMLIGLTVFLVINFTRKSLTSQVDLKEIGALGEQIKSIEKDIKLSIAQEMVKISEQASKTSETNNEKLERFQKNITDTLITRFDALNKQVDFKLAEINKKVDEKLAEGFKGTSEAITSVRERLKLIDEALVPKNIHDISVTLLVLNFVKSK